MSRRIEIELTSTRDDGTWTWRAAGAKQPKGSLDGSLLSAGASVGDQLRADVETSLDGTDVLAVLPPKAKNRAQVETIELNARPLKDDELVIETRAPRGRGGRDRGDRRGGRDGRGGAREGRGGRPERGPRGDGPGGDRPQGERSGRGPRPGGGDRPDRGRHERPAPPAKPKAKRLRAGRVHRKVALDLLAPEEQVIAEQVLRGGVPAVRQAVEKMNEQAKAEGRPEVKAEPLVAVAERLLPALRMAEWRDKAEAAIADITELDLRDLRSVVVAAEGSAKDDDTRALAAQLRDGLAARVDSEQAAWLAEIAETMADGRIVRALRLSSRPPKAGAPLPVDMAAKLAEAASAALTDDTMVDRWATVLDALSFSPVRLTVAPASKPAEPSAELVAAVTRVAARVPKVAEAFGIEAAPDTGRKRPRGAKAGGRAQRSPKSAGPGGSAPIPPPPPMPTAIDEAAPARHEPAASSPPEVPPELDVVSATTEPEPATSAAPQDEAAVSPPVPAVESTEAEPIADAAAEAVEAPASVVEPEPDLSPTAQPVSSASEDGEATTPADATP